MPRSWQTWLASWNNLPHLRTLAGRLGPVADNQIFPVIGGAIALAATVTMTLPLVPVVSALVALRPARWKEIVCWTVLGSSLGAALLAFAFGALSLPWLNARMPEVMNSPHWQHLADWGASHGWWVLASIAALPIAQTPALLLAAMLGMPLTHVFFAVALGKTIKYSAVARATQLVSKSGLPLDTTTAGDLASNHPDRQRR